MKSKKRADGGSVSEAGGNPKVFAEAKKRKAGGRLVGAVGGGLARPRLDRPGRKLGGRVGADKSPLSSAARVSSPSKAAN